MIPSRMNLFPTWRQRLQDQQILNLIADGILSDRDYELYTKLVNASEGKLASMHIDNDYFKPEKVLGVARADLRVLAICREAITQARASTANPTSISDATISSEGVGAATVAAATTTTTGGSDNASGGERVDDSDRNHYEGGESHPDVQDVISVPVAQANRNRKSDKRPRLK